MSGGDDNPLGLPAEPPAPEPREEPPADSRGRQEEWVADHNTETRDFTPALGKRGEPASWRPAGESEHVALAHPSWGDAGWSFLYGPDTRYGDVEPDHEEVVAASRRMRAETTPDDPRGPFIKPPVWASEIPLYFWVGGMASGSAFVALAADLAGDEWSASVARKVALALVVPAPALLIADLGRPARYLNMLRIFKPRSPMNLGAWCLTGFTAVGAGAVGADLLGLNRTARRLGAVNAVLGGYLGSYAGVLLATTAVPVWARSRIFLGPIFVSTAAATGAAITRLVLTATGQLPVGHPTRVALNHIQGGAMLAELTLSTVNERRLGRAGDVLSEGRTGRLFRTAQLCAATGVTLNLLGVRRTTPWGQHVASVLYLTAGLVFRFAWIEAGKASAHDDEVLATMSRGRTERRAVSKDRAPRTSGPAVVAARAWSGAVGRTSLLVERLRRHA